MQALKKLWQSKGTVDAPSDPAGRVDLELSLPLNSLEQWKATMAANPFLFSASYVDALVDMGKHRGVYSPFFREHIPPSEVSVLSNNYREAFLARGLNPRQRAALDL